MTATDGRKKPRTPAQTAAVVANIAKAREAKAANKGKKKRRKKGRSIALDAIPAPPKKIGRPPKTRMPEMDALAMHAERVTRAIALFETGLMLLRGKL